MTKSKSLSRIRTIALVILLPVLVTATWFGKGLYDRIFMLEGHVVVVNATAEDHKIQCSFPSGQKLEVALKAGTSLRSLVGKTGEGSVDIVIDGTRREEVGYVTSMNGLIILTIGEDRIVLSQVSLSTRNKRMESNR